MSERRACRVLGQPRAVQRYTARVRDDEAPLTGQIVELALSLRDGRFRLRRSEACRGCEHFIRWYTEHGTPWLERRMARWAEWMGVEPKGVAVRDLGYGWGSCGHARRVNFHWVTMLPPPPIVDYVIVHELAHLAVPNHGPAFWRKVGLALPEYEMRKAWLTAHGGAAGAEVISSSLSRRYASPPCRTDGALNNCFIKSSTMPSISAGS